MAQCANPWSYDHTNEKNNRGYATRKAQKERQALKRATRKFARVCQAILIAEQLDDMAPERPTTTDLVHLTQEIGWHIDDVLEMYDDHEELPPQFIFECQQEYEDYMFAVDPY